MTLEEAVEVIKSILALAETVRRRYYNFECEVCGTSYHPRSGKRPPKEKVDGCGHAHFREAYAYWDSKTNDWYPE